MKTDHEIYYINANNMKEVASESVDLIVTSPPYPMIEMWDEIFFSINPEIERAIKSENGSKAFQLMNLELDKVWQESARVLKNGGIACINIGDATRKIGEDFQLYSNHTAITDTFQKLDFHVLPVILWRKQSNKPNKFMGSGMYPPNAYVTLEHEYILIFRKGSKRDFLPKHKELRRNSAYFWEERNNWFSDIWFDLKGVTQKLNKSELRTRSAAFPFELPYRLINMYSILDDVVLDPFLGTGTTTLASMCAGRNSIGIEIDEHFSQLIHDRILNFPDISKSFTLERIDNHLKFVEDRQENKGSLKYQSEHYNFRVMTRQETLMKIPVVQKISSIKQSHNYSVEYVDLQKEIIDRRSKKQTIFDF